LNFLKEKVRKYQEKKLIESKEKIKLHTEIKNRLEGELKSNNGNENELKKEIEKQDKFIKIWEKNVDSINKQIKKLDF
jgi:chromosome segregation ATPase